MRKTIELQGDDAFILGHLSRRIDAGEESMNQAAQNLKQARQQHSAEVRKEFAKRGINVESWGTRTLVDGTVLIDYEAVDEPTTAELKRRYRKSPPK